MSLPPELRLLCTQITDSATPLLIRSLPTLADCVLRCEILATPQDAKVRANAPEASVLVHKFKTSLNTLLFHRDPQRRFVGVVLVKAVVDVGGWECLNGAEKWVGSLLAVLQKNDPMPSKELAIFDLTKIYMLARESQTLTRTIATPTVSQFVDACVKLLKQTPSEKRPKVPLSVVETVFESLSTIVPLYATTIRHRSSDVDSIILPYLAPTLSDGFLTPESLQVAARKVYISLHRTTPKKGGDGAEWAKRLENTIRVYHQTADMVFRAVEETCPLPANHRPLKVDFHRPPGIEDGTLGGYPAWSGIIAGSQRLIALLRLLGDFLRYPTDVQVRFLVSDLTTAFSRAAHIARASRKPDAWKQALQVRADTAKEEQAELWSVMPGIHEAALHLALVLCQRLDHSFLPHTQGTIDDTVRIFRSDAGCPAVRSASYKLLSELLRLVGPTLPKERMGPLEMAISGCCRDLQEHAGLLDAKPAIAGGAGGGPDLDASKKQKKNSGGGGGGGGGGGVVPLNVNADLFLSQKTGGERSSAGGATAAQQRCIDPEHAANANCLLVASLEHLPQHHVRPALRGLLDQTAVATGNRDAMVASVLRPFRNHQGKMYPSVLPFLTRQFPGDQLVEVLRRRVNGGGSSSSSSSSYGLSLPLPFLGTEKEMEEGDGDGPTSGESEDVDMDGEEADQETPPAHELSVIGEDAAMADHEEDGQAAKNAFQPFQAKANAELDDKDDDDDDVDVDVDTEILANRQQEEDEPKEEDLDEESDEDLLKVHVLGVDSDSGDE